MYIGTGAFGLDPTLEAAIIAIVWGVFYLQVINPTTWTKIHSAKESKDKMCKKKKMKKSNVWKCVGILI